MTEQRKRILNLPGIAYGGDYNPEQWDEAVWREDMVLMKAAGVNLVTLGVFSWALLEPEEGRFDFSGMDRILDLLYKAGIRVNLATATAAQPAWASLAYPDIAPVDERGLAYSHGSRQTYCPNSPSYRRLADRLTRTLAKRYLLHPALALWHLNNEVGCHVQTCTCDTCAARFRLWLKARYGGLEGVNRAWGTAFWSQRYGAWEEIVPPRLSTANLNPAARLDYRRFMSDSFVGILAAEAAILREEGAALGRDVPICSNLMWTDAASWFALRPHLDLLAYDSYPDPGAEASWRWSAFMFDLTRGHLGGRPWLLMEQAPSQVNWRDYNVAKEPGTMRLWSLQALAHGSDSVLFFQWRASLRGSEQFHSAMVPHGGPGTRRFKEVAELGKELGDLTLSGKGLAGLAGSRRRAPVALVYSYDAWWFTQYRPFPSAAFDYQAIAREWHEALGSLHVDVDILSPEDEVEGYGLVLAPALVLASEATLARLAAYVEEGGTLVTGLGAGLVDEEGQVRAGGYGGALARLCGVRIEEFEVEAGWSGPATGSVTARAGAGPERPSLPTSHHPAGLGPLAGRAQPGEAHTWYDLVEALPGAAILARYTGPAWFAEGQGSVGFGALARASQGRGEAYWLGTRPDRAWLEGFFGQVLDSRGIQAPLEAGPHVESGLRVDAQGQPILFVLNHSGEEAQVKLKEGAWRLAHGPGASLEGRSLSLPAQGVAILSKG